MPTALQRRFPIGAEAVAGGVHFRVWAPLRKTVEVILEGSGSFPLEREPDAYFSGFLDVARPGMQYQFRLDRGGRVFPDPASRFQPAGPHGPSQIVDPFAYRWEDVTWRGLQLEGQVIYETHIGTLTPAGTWKAACEILPELAETGVTILELMPIAEFSGTFGWGYDGTALFAPTHLYGTPDEFRAFVDTAHSAGLGVVLDVVYNHLGPDGNYLKEFSADYFTDRYTNEWGEAINFDGPGSKNVRDFFVSNAAYWIEEFHLDGLRLDATQQIFDSSEPNIMAEITLDARRAAGDRSIVIIAENEHQNARLVESADEGGYGLDAIWNDDFHHSAHVAVTGANEAYYSDYGGTPQELVSLAKWGFLYQGQYSIWQRQRRGHPAFGVKAASFINYLDNHDQIANSSYGARLHELTTSGRYRAITALLLLMPGTPMLFQGQEYGVSTPFLYFADHRPELAALVEQGRAEFLSQFRSVALSHTEFAMGKPQDRTTFEKCKLDHAERLANAHVVALHRDLLRLRREDPVFRAQRSDWIDGAVLGPEAFALRFFSGSNGDRLLLVNLGRGLTLRPAAEPLLAPPELGKWEVLWWSDHPSYLKSSADQSSVAHKIAQWERPSIFMDSEAQPAPLLRKAGTWNIPGHCSVVMYESH